jgi:hypothetical protein
MERSLHLGPYLGREPELTDEVDGVLCNPMLQAHASQIGLATAADFLREPEGFDGLGSWFHAIADVEGERRGDLSLVARACADGPLQAPRHIEMHSLVNSLEPQIDGPGWHYPVRILDIHLSGHVSARHGWADAPDDPLGAELDPWLADMETEAKAGLAAVRLIQQTFPVARWSRDGHGKAALPDPELAMLHAFALLYSWRAARRSDHVVFGPRFAVYPAVVQLADDVGARPGVDVDLAVVEDESAIDRLCRLALDRYRAWTREPPTSLRVTRRRILDPDGPGIPVEVAPDGTFDAPREKFGLLVEAGPDATELLQDENLSAPPFPDARLD